jgi:hypothetical protein
MAATAVIPTPRRLAAPSNASGLNVGYEYEPVELMVPLGAYTFVWLTSGTSGTSG